MPIERPLRVMVYKRTHVGDPDARGVFGLNDCMGSVRWRQFDAVIGVGGVGAEPVAHRIARKITWIGIGPHKTSVLLPGYRGPQVTFDSFLLLDHLGPFLKDIAPAFAQYFYSQNRRVVMSAQLCREHKAEIESILDVARDLVRRDVHLPGVASSRGNCGRTLCRHVGRSRCAPATRSKHRDDCDQ